jgi:hypothetical protein
MSAYLPPLANLPIFDSDVFTSNDANITISQGDNRYLKFPVGQGSQTIPNLTVPGTASFNYITLNNNNPVTFVLWIDDSNSRIGKNSPISGANNAFYGIQTAQFATSAGTCSGFGHNECLSTLTSGQSNSAFGSGALKSISTTSFNSSLGYNSLYACTSNYNTAIGAYSGLNLTTGTGCCFIGHSAGAGLSSATASNSICLGANSICTGSNQVVLGSSADSVIIPRNIRYNTTQMFSYAFTGSAFQTLTTATDTIINFPTANGRNGTVTGLTYSAGVFTNSNSYTVTLMITTSISFDTNATGSRLVYIYAPTTGTRHSATFISPQATQPTTLSTTAYIVLNAAETFSVYANQTSGGNLNTYGTPATYPSRVSIMVF